MTEQTTMPNSNTLVEIVREHPFFAGLNLDYCELVGGCAKNVRFNQGEFLLREGEAADEFYLIRHGRVAIDIHMPGRPDVTIQTLGPGDIVGVSWLIPPYEWTHNARALETVRAISLDAKCLRGKCDADPALGYEMMKRFIPILIQRLQGTRFQLLDVYGRID